MKKNKLNLFLILLICISVICFGGCQSSEKFEATSNEKETSVSSEVSQSPKGEFCDYAEKLTLDMDSESLKQEVTINGFVDGDTTHFNVPESICETGVLKARYLAIDTPESTGKIEEYGKAASKFTREKLSSASSVIIESDDDKWNLDSTGGRYLVWVWYRTNDDEPYRNLNLEILQNGLAAASSTANNRYGKICMEALNQAKSQKLNLFSGEKDPDFFYGDAIELTLKELRCNIEDYNGMKVAFNGVITKNSGNGVYIESYDEETDMYYGMSIYYGFNLPGKALDILSVGNEARVVGTVSYYEAGETYQVSGLSYRLMNPEDPNNVKLISEGNQAAFLLTEPVVFAEGKVTLEVNGESKTYDYANLALATTLEMKNLKVKSAYTADNEESSSFGAMTLNCEADGVNITVRTSVLRDENNEIIKEDLYVGKTIDIKGIADYFGGEYQIKVLSADDITIIE